ncbi:MAG: benzaldehyde dehydrogenase [Burkholderiaceae bacterium]
MFKTQTDLLIDKKTHGGKIFCGEWLTPQGGTAPVTDKASGDTLFETGIANAEDVDHAVQMAQAAQKDWSAQPATVRGDIIRQFARQVEQHADELREWIVRETGSIPPKGDFEIFTTVREALEVAGLAGRPVGEILASSSGRTSYARRIPVGVVGVITPWNSPFILAARVILPALVLGNAVILKPDLQTPVCGGHLVARLFELAGLPRGLLHVVPGGPDTGEALVAHPGTGMISFTGSTAVGRRIGEVTGRMLKRAALELGGNNALIVLDDADLDKVSSAAAFGSFFHQGQICFTAGRHLVHERIAQAYTERLAGRASALHSGNPHLAQVHLGPMINRKQVDRAQALLQRSIDQGARLESGGGIDGLYFQPTVLSGVTPDMDVFKDEIFAPVAPITTFRTDEEAIDLANRTEYGLVASIFSGSQSRAMHMASRMKTGIVHINDQTVNHDVFGAIGGMGASGNGARSGNVTSLDEYTHWQWITVGDDVPPYPF